jgi:CubicO group peptidase (beta-lactamase class C family)
LIHDEIEQILKRSIVFRGVAPGASAAVAAFSEAGWRRAEAAAGARSGADATPVSVETLYDLASLTKPVLACTLARAIRGGAFGWDTSLGELLSAARGTASEHVSVELLLSHRAGLEAHVRLRDSGVAPQRWLGLCADRRRADCSGPPPAAGFASVYSDLGYILLGAALEAQLQCPLEESFRREVIAPLGLELGSAAHWNRKLSADQFLARVAPTEVLAERGGELLGVVHDDNAWDLAGEGVAGHAGLFGTARGAAGLGMAVLDGLAGRQPGWLLPEELAVLVRERPGGSLRAGFDGKAPVGSSAGDRFGVHAFGHLGFTGTSIWCDPAAQIVVVLLTNRVWPTRENILIRSVRPDVHGAFFGLAADLLEADFASGRQ